MSEEYLDIVDENGNPTGEKELRSVVHEKGLWHKVSTVYFFRINGNHVEFLTHLRSAYKEQNPNKWAFQFGGHVETGQTILDTAIKEVREEVGIAIDDNDLIIGFTDAHDEVDNKQIVSRYYYNFLADTSTLSFDDGEVQEVKWMDEYTIAQSMHDHPEIWNSSETTLVKVIKDLKSKI